MNAITVNLLAMELKSMLVFPLNCRSPFSASLLYCHPLISSLECSTSLQLHTAERDE